MLNKKANRLINARNWAVLVKPEQIVREDGAADNMYGKFVCEPLERGYGCVGCSWLLFRARLSFR